MEDGESWRRERPPTGVQKPIGMPPVHQVRLRNGLRVGIISVSGSQLVSVRLLLMAGPGESSASDRGEALLLPELLPEARISNGTKLRDGLAALGGELTRLVTDDLIVLSFEIMADDVPQALAYLAAAVTSPNIDPNVIPAVRASSVAAANASIDDVRARALQCLVGNVIPTSGTWVSGGAIRKATLPRVLRYHRRRWVARRAAIVVVGDVVTADMENVIDRLFGRWASGDRPSTPPSETPKLRPGLLFTDVPSSRQTEVAFLLPGISRHDQDWTALTVANSVFGGGSISRLNKLLRDSKKLTYSARTFVHRVGDVGFVVGRASVPTEHAQTALELVRHELNRFEREPPDEQEIASAKEVLRRVVLGRLMTNGETAALLDDFMLRRVPFKSYANMIADVDDVRQQDVMRVYKRIFKSDGLLAVFAGPTSELHSLGVTAEKCEVPSVTH
jgi:zinc protease